MKLQESGEMYLETILILSKKGITVRSIDICEYMGFSKPSVSRAVGVLKNGGFITVDNSGFISLTKQGYETAKKIYDRHNLLTQVLIKLGVDENIASDDACKMEHFISDQTFNALKNFLKNT
ncbi:MAG: metal-dependent transcriptional regulator [Clostridiales bacterium]|nr:metal-dependent transcriptional regulator [Clostridiales bacterium]